MMVCCPSIYRLWKKKIPARNYTEKKVHKKEDPIADGICHGCPHGLKIYFWEDGGRLGACPPHRLKPLPLSQNKVFN